MFHHAAFPAAQPNSSLKAPRVLIPSSQRRNNARSRPLTELLPLENRLRIGRTSAAEKRESDFGASGSLPPRIPSSTRGHASGPNRRPAARRRSASLAAPLRGLGSSQNKFESRGKERRSNFFRAPPRKHSLALGSRAHSLASKCDPSKIREIQRNGDHHHVPEQSHPHRLPRQRRRSSHQQRPQLHHSLAGNQVLLQEGRQVHLAHRMAPLRRLRQARRVRQHAQEGRTYPGRGRDCAAGSTTPKKVGKSSREEDHLGDPGELDSQAGSGREGQPGRQENEPDAPPRKRPHRPFPFRDGEPG
jgi:hypothetical protein